MHLREGLQTHVTVAQRYGDLVRAGELAHDPAQEALAAALDRLLVEIREKRVSTKSSSLGWLFGRRRGPEPVRGLYIHGSVGRGKTRLMDLFFELVPARRKRRVHFNAFMADVHDRIDRHRRALRNGEARGDDPIPPVARALAEEAWVLCFDEFTVTDIADAMILSRLFSALFAQGVVLVATSNVAPDDLYRDGLNRALFVPFIALLKEHAVEFRLGEGPDYRQDRLQGMPVYVSPLSEETDRRMDAAWALVTDGGETGAREIVVKGRSVAVSRACGRAARFTFEELCGRPLGARDYLAIVEHFETILLENVPVMDESRRNEAKRFILLVDTLYDRGARLLVSAEAEPEGLYAGRSGTESFEFARTASRLSEMRGKAWLDAWAARHSERAAAG